MKAERSDLWQIPVYLIFILVACALVSDSIDVSNYPHKVSAIDFTFRVIVAVGGAVLASWIFCKVVPWLLTKDRS